MKQIRIGKDISLRWEITTDGVAMPLEGRDITVELKSPIGKVSNMPFSVDGNVLIMTYYGYEQTSYGEYSLTLWENMGKPGQNVVDAISAFKLVRTSQEEEDFIGGDLQVECVDLGTANLDILLGSATPGDSPDLSALKRKVDANTTRISAVEANVEENTANIAGAAADASAALKSARGAQTTVTTLGEELRAAILELRMSIPRGKAFIVETGSLSGFYYVDDKKVYIPENTKRHVNFNDNFSISEVWGKNPGIKCVNTTFTTTYSFKSIFAMFFGCSSLTSLDLSTFDTSAVTNMGYVFFQCTSLTSLDLSTFDTSAVTSFENTFFGCSSLTSILLGPNFFKTSAVTSIDLSSCSKWTNETVVTSLVTNSYDRASAGLNALTLKLHANTNASLTDEQKATITSKGYTIA